MNSNVGSSTKNSRPVYIDGVVYSRCKDGLFFFDLDDGVFWTYCQAILKIATRVVDDIDWITDHNRIDWAFGQTQAASCAGVDDLVHDVLSRLVFDK